MKAHRRKALTPKLLAKAIRECMIDAIVGENNKSKILRKIVEFEKLTPETQLDFGGVYGYVEPDVLDGDGPKYVLRFTVFVHYDHLENGGVSGDDLTLGEFAFMDRVNIQTKKLDE